MKLPLIMLYQYENILSIIEHKKNMLDEAITQTEKKDISQV